MKKTLYILLFLIFFMAGTVHAITVTVGGSGQCGGACDYSSIQSAINALTSDVSDTIQVYPEGAGDNTYNTTIDDAGYSNKSVIGMVADRAITISGTGVGQLSGDQNVRVSGETGWVFENLTFQDNDNVQYNASLYEAGVTFTNCRFNSSPSGSGEYYEAHLNGGSLTIEESLFDGSGGSKSYYQAYAKGTVGQSGTASIKYTEFAGSNVYISIDFGTSSTQANNCTVSYNYLHSSMRSNNIGMMYFRQTSGHTITYNLLVPSSFVSSSATAAIVVRQAAATNNTMTYNTIVLPTSGYSNDAGCFGFDMNAGDNPGNANTFKNNICVGGSHDTTGDLTANNSSPVQYNYFYDPETGWQDTDTATYLTAYSNNTETLVNAPGFVGSGTIWETDGTDNGTTSDYYILANGAAAANTGEGGVDPGAFGEAAGADPTPSPNKTRIIKGTLQ